MVSVIVPTVGRTESLERCLRSIVGQTVGDFEIIVVNGGKDDIALDYGFLPKRTKYLHNPGTCYADSMNKGCEIADGGYLTVPGIANDIEVTACWDLPLVRAFTAKKGPRGEPVGMAIPGVREQIVPEGPVYGGFIHPRALFNLNHAVYPQYAGYGLVSRKAYETVGPMDTGFRPIYLEDVDYGLRIWQAGFIIQPCPESLIVHHHDMRERHSANTANREYFYSKWGIYP